MRTTLAEHGSDRRGTEAVHEEPELARDNPRRHREPHDEREDDDPHGSWTSRQTLRHGIQQVREDLRRLVRS
jgi:hypothetical protein